MQSITPLKISLICATYNRTIELEQLLKSLVAQTYKNFEIVIVDQNKNGLIDHVCQYYKQYLDLIHVKSNQLGLSINRNLGIKVAVGNILGFPDDDCTYYPDTLESIYNIFSYSNLDILYGQIYNRQAKKGVMRKWPGKPFTFTNLKQIMLYSSSIVIFTKNRLSNRFDENFGVNQNFGALEDIELCYRHFIKKNKLIYSPSVQVCHPEVSSTFLNSNKAYNYGRGWGAFFAKYIDFKILPLFIGIFGYVGILFLRDMFLLRPTAKGRLYSLSGRINGFFDYLINHKLKYNNEKPRAKC